MASFSPLPLFMHERVERARGLLADSADNQGSRELSSFVEAMELTERFHSLLLDSQGRRRLNVSVKDKQEVREQSGASSALGCAAVQAGAAARRQEGSAQQATAD